MYRDPMDDIFESFVRAAVIENGLREAEACPQNDALFDIHLSSKCERSVTRNACKLKRRKKLLRMSKYVQQTAAIVMISVGISFGFFLSSNNVRAACQDVLVQVYGKFVDVNIDKENPSRATLLNISYIPPDYKEVKRVENKAKGYVEYKNSKGQSLIVRYTNIRSNLLLDHEHYIIKNKNLSTGNGTLLLSRDNSRPNMLFWATNTNSFTLKAFLPESELTKIANSADLSVMK